MKIDFYYFSYQCPLNNSMIKLLNEYEDKLDISYYDISKNFELAKKMNMFFPTLTVVNNEFRFFNPLKRDFLELLCKCVLPKESPYRPKLGVVEKNEKIVSINTCNSLIACSCTGLSCTTNSEKKVEFLNCQKLTYSGFINIDKNNCLLGGAEYMPSLLIPYDIPKDIKTAFITCTYLSDEKYDYKSGPLRALEEYLSNDFNKILVISDELGVFPNGNLDFFIRNGYIDIGIISKEHDYCTLHLLYKNI